MTSAHSPTLGMNFFGLKNSFFEKFMKISYFLHLERVECNFSIIFRFYITYIIYLSIIMFIENKHRLSFINIVLLILKIKKLNTYSILSISPVGLGSQPNSKIEYPTYSILAQLYPTLPNFSPTLPNFSQK